METDRRIGFRKLIKAPVSCFYGIQDLAEPKNFSRSMNLEAMRVYSHHRGASSKCIRPNSHAKYAGEAR